MKRVAIGLLGTRLDGGTQPGRWEDWRPTVSLFQHQDLLCDRFELLAEDLHQVLRDQVAADIELISMNDVNAAYKRLHRSDVKYRFVIDMATLSS